MGKTAITNVCVFDGHAFHGPTTVVLDGNLILSASSTTTFNATTVVDGTGHTLLPGLLDCHAHANKIRHLEQYASYGITTVIDYGAHTDVLPLRSAANAPGSRLPGYKTALWPAMHPDSMHAKMRALPPEKLVPGIEAVEAFVAERKAEGSDYLKIIGDTPGFDHATVEALVAAANNHGLKVLVHAVQKAGYERIAKIGAHVLTHIPIDGVLDDATVAEMKANVAVCVPTVGMMAKFIEMAPGYKLGVALASLRKIHEAGIRICAGSDANDIPGLAFDFGSTLHAELDMMTRAGMSNVEVLRAATSSAAVAFGYDDKGMIKDGLRADLVLVEGNPADDISVTKQLRRVWVGGCEVPVAPMPA